MSNTLVAYYRVSTTGQGRSGLGLEAQTAAVVAFAAENGSHIVTEYIETASGKGTDALTRRPQLAAALAHAHRIGAKLAVAKLDRLSRNVAFIAGLMEHHVGIIVTSLPGADPFMLHIYAALAEQERTMISSRTRAALAAARVRGTVLGGDRGYRPPAPPNPALATIARRAAADQRANSLLVEIEAVRDQVGDNASLHLLAAGLTARGVAKSRGGSAWTATDVRRALARVGAQAPTFTSRLTSRST